MPKKEISDVLQDLSPAPTEIVYVVTKESRVAVGESVVALDGRQFPVTVAVETPELSEDLTAGLNAADDVVLWDPGAELLAEKTEVLALVPAEDAPVDELLEGVVETALARGIRCRAMNEQLYDINFDEEDGEVPAAATAEPVSPQPDPAPEGAEGPVEIPSASEMEAMSRADLKALANQVDARPTDWRSKKGIIEAILVKQVEDKGDDPYDGAAEEPVDSGSALDDLADQLKELATDEETAAAPPHAPAQVVETPRPPAGPTEEYVMRSLTNVTPTPETVAKIESLRTAYKSVAGALFDLVPSSPERTLAIRDLETSAMWAVKTLVLRQEES